ncbi:MAG TPA: hypothetical protein VFZ66_09965 [Herpetosiphonaceae bacterium]
MTRRGLSYLAGLLLIALLPWQAAAQQPRRWLADPELITTRKVIGGDGGAFREVRDSVIDIDLIDASSGWAVSYSGLLQFDGRWWRPVENLGSRIAMRGIDMRSASDGWIVGSTFVSGGPTNLYYARYNGSAWQFGADIVRKDGSVGPQSGSLADVVVFPDGSAIAVGIAYDQVAPGNYRQRPLVLVFDGSAWRDQTPDTWRDGQLTDLSMLSQSEGWATGLLGRPGGEGSEAVRPAIVRLKDGRWTEETLPRLPITNQPFTMYGVNVRPEGDGYAIFYDAGTRCPNTELLRYGGGTWTTVPRETYGNAPILAFALIPGSNQGWATQSGCQGREPSQPSRRLRFDNGVFMVDPGGARLAPDVYALLSQDMQWAASGGAMMRYSDEQLPTEPLPPGIEADGLYFKETGHYVDDAFIGYYRSHGLEFGDRGNSARESLALFGYPVSEGFDEINPDTGKVLRVQYFERARFEYHRDNPNPYKVLLGRLGANTLLRLGRTFGSDPAPPAPGPQCQRFNESPFPLCPPFRDFWNRSGGLPVFGFPISVAADEQSQTDGKTYLTQWFERERLEYHPENRGTPYEILLGLLAAEELRARGYLPPN